ncbi:hypothetical protein RI092_05940 [Lactococcus cremoris]|nr:hypothetical protein [Lactococcus cremoris]MDR9867357.1 hypothetical protein [Lactococcus cremoris]
MIVGFHPISRVKLLFGAAFLFVLYVIMKLLNMGVSNLLAFFYLLL